VPNWFTEFTKGSDVPGVRHFRDSVEQDTWNLNKETAIQHGWTETNVTYIINEWGYRGQIQPGNRVDAAFGCSITFGASVDETQHWPGILEIANCGQPASSNDKIARLAISYINTFSPKSIYVCWTYPQRREWIDEDGNIEAFKNLSLAEKHERLKSMNLDWKTSYLILGNHMSNEYNYEKNKLLLSSVCKSKEVKLNEVTVMDIDHHSYPPARDLQHPGPDWHATIAAELSEY
jgi:hypothetical protein